MKLAEMSSVVKSYDPTQLAKVSGSEYLIFFQHKVAERKVLLKPLLNFWSKMWVIFSLLLFPTFFRDEEIIYIGLFLDIWNPYFIFSIVLFFCFIFRHLQGSKPLGRTIFFIFIILNWYLYQFQRIQLIFLKKEF